MLKLPSTSGELDVPINILSPFTLSLQVLVAPVEGEGGLGVKLSSAGSRTEKSKFASFLNVFASCESWSSSYDMWSLVLVPVLDEKPCQQLL